MVLRLVVALSLSLGLPAFLPTDSHARWSTEPTPVLRSNEYFTLVAAASDGADGAIVAFECIDSTDSNRHPLRAIHLRADGTVDPAWPETGVFLSSYDTVVRSGLVVVADSSGGAYVCWAEGNAVLLTRVDAAGHVPAAWPARGRVLGTIMSAGMLPQALSDGAGGVYVGWLTGSLSAGSGRVMRIGPGNTSAAGWPNTPRPYGSSSGLNYTYTLQFAMNRTRDGGLCLVWARAFVDPALTEYSGEWRATRIRPDGLASPGWTAGGTLVGPFDSRPLFEDFQHEIPMAERRCGVAEAEDGGLYVLTDEYDSTAVLWNPTLHKFAANRTVAAGWTEQGHSFAAYVTYYLRRTGEESSFRLEADSAGTAHVSLTSVFGVDAPAVRMWLRCPANGAAPQEKSGGPPADPEHLLSRGGLLYTAFFREYGARWRWDWEGFYSASVEFPDGRTAGLTSEMIWLPVVPWCGDVALAPTSGDGAIFLWAQHWDRHGLFARRFTPTGEVTSVPAALAPPRALRLHFDPVRGVVADGALAPGARVSLHDVGGRRVLEARTPGNMAGPFALPGSRALPPGVYFVRATLRDGASAMAKVVVWR